jgi:hypothetical protein
MVYLYKSISTAMLLFIWKSAGFYRLVYFLQYSLMNQILFKVDVNWRATFNRLIITFDLMQTLEIRLVCIDPNGNIMDVRRLTLYQGMHIENLRVKKVMEGKYSIHVTNIEDESRLFQKSVLLE